MLSVPLSTLEVVSVTLQISSFTLGVPILLICPPPNVSTITQRAYDPIVNYYGFVLRSNHKRLRLKRIELKRIRVEEYLDRIRQDVCDDVADNLRVPINNALGDALPNDSDSDDS